MSFQEHPRHGIRAVGEGESFDSLAIRDRLASAYKGIHSNRPQVLDCLAQLFVSLQHHYNGRTRPICLAAGMSDAQYRHISEGLSGDGVPAVVIALLKEAAPGTFWKVMGELAEHDGYEVRQKPRVIPLKTPFEAVANLAKDSGGLQEAAIRSLDDGVIDAQEGKDLASRLKVLEADMAEIKAHVRGAK